MTHAAVLFHLILKDLLNRLYPGAWARLTSWRRRRLLGGVGPLALTEGQPARRDVQGDGESFDHVHARWPR